jgi:hypothetical protein
MEALTELAAFCAPHEQNSHGRGAPAAVLPLYASKCNAGGWYF